jgi:hypothetical protein
VAKKPTKETGKTGKAAPAREARIDYILGRFKAGATLNDRPKLILDLNDAEVAEAHKFRTVSSTVAYEDVGEAWQRMVDAPKAITPEAAAGIFEFRCNALYAVAYEKGDVSGGMKAAEGAAAVHGVTTKRTGTEHSGSIETGGMRFEDMTPEQVAAWKATVPKAGEG